MQNWYETSIVSFSLADWIANIVDFIQIIVRTMTTQVNKNVYKFKLIDKWILTKYIYLLVRLRTLNNEISRIHVISKSLINLFRYVLWRKFWICSILDNTASYLVIIVSPFSRSRFHKRSNLVIRYMLYHQQRKIMFPTQTLSLAGQRPVSWLSLAKLFSKVPKMVTRMKWKILLGVEPQWQLIG